MGNSIGKDGGPALPLSSKFSLEYLGCTDNDSIADAEQDFLCIDVTDAIDESQVRRASSAMAASSQYYQRAIEKERAMLAATKASEDAALKVFGTAPGQPHLPMRRFRVKESVGADGVSKREFEEIIDKATKLRRKQDHHHHGGHHHHQKVATNSQDAVIANPIRPNSGQRDSTNSRASLASTIVGDRNSNQSIGEVACQDSNNDCCEVQHGGQGGGSEQDPNRVRNVASYIPKSFRQRASTNELKESSSDLRKELYEADKSVMYRRSRDQEWAATAMPPSITSTWK